MDRELEREIGIRIKDMPDQNPPRWLVGSVMKRVAPEPSRAPGFWARWTRPRSLTFSPPALAAAMGCMMLAFAVGFVSGTGWNRAADFRGAGAELTAVGRGAESSFLLGRSLMAAGLPEDAAGHLARAVELAPLNAEYRIWLARAYAAFGAVDRELKQYRLASAVARPSTETMSEVAQGFMGAGRYDSAADVYARILSDRPDDRAVLYESAAVMHRLGREEPARAYLKRLLILNAEDGLAVKAAGLLNRMGDYDFRSTVIGRRRIVLRSPRLEGGAVSADRRREMGRVADILRHGRDIVLHVVAYDQGNREGAKRLAMGVKQEILNTAPELAADRNPHQLVRQRRGPGGPAAAFPGPFASSV